MFRDIIVDSDKREIHVGGVLSSTTWTLGTKAAEEMVNKGFPTLDIREECTQVVVDNLTIEFRLTQEEIDRATEILRKELTLFEN
jgi:hypothetical protein